MIQIIVPLFTLETLLKGQHIMSDLVMKKFYFISFGVFKHFLFAIKHFQLQILSCKFL
jgi:hypothetical protein